MAWEAVVGNSVAASAKAKVTSGTLEDIIQADIDMSQAIADATEQTAYNFEEISRWSVSIKDAIDELSRELTDSVTELSIRLLAESGASQTADVVNNQIELNRLLMGTSRGRTYSRAVSYVDAFFGEKQLVGNTEVNSYEPLYNMDDEWALSPADANCYLDHPRLSSVSSTSSADFDAVFRTFSSPMPEGGYPVASFRRFLNYKCDPLVTRRRCTSSVDSHPSFLSYQTGNKLDYLLVERSASCVTWSERLPTIYLPAPDSCYGPGFRQSTLNNIEADYLREVAVGSCAQSRTQILSGKILSSLGIRLVAQHMDTPTVVISS